MSCTRVSDSRLELTVPEQVPVIRLEDLQRGEQLGQGAYDKTYKGSLTLPKGDVVPVAIKEYMEQQAASPWMFKEASVLQELNGAAGAPQLYGVSCEDTFILVMEYCAGDCYDSFMKTASVPDALTVFLELVSSVKTLHSAGYSHCDLQPGNIIISKSQHKLTVRLIDFGLAEKLDEKPPELVHLWTDMDDEKLFRLGASINSAVVDTPAGQKFREATLGKATGKGGFRLPKAYWTGDLCPPGMVG